MRRNKRGVYEDTDNYKAVLLIAGGILLVAIVSFFVVYGIYSKKMESVELATVNKGETKIDVANIVSNTEEVSSSIGKKVDEIKNEIEQNTTKVDESINLSTGDNSAKASNNVDTSNEESNNNNSDNVSANSVDNENVISVEDGKDVNVIESDVQTEKEPSFINPVEDGEMMREFAKENLVYSETLTEWITHLGVDIKAPKTTVVKAAEAGEVESIKNDPRYGLTVIIKHTNNYKTVYSNLLTAEFVSVGDKVTAGQSIGTVGNSAAFEIADEPHLHFEIIKDNEKVDPTLYVK